MRTISDEEKNVFCFPFGGRFAYNPFCNRSTSFVRQSSGVISRLYVDTLANVSKINEGCTLDNESLWKSSVTVDLRFRGQTHSSKHFGSDVDHGGFPCILSE